MNYFHDFNFSSVVRFVGIHRPRYFLIVFSVLLFATTLFIVSLASGSDLADQRTDFTLAVAALESGDYNKFLRLKQRNKDYLLYPYLEYYELRQRLSTATNDEFDAFINRYKGTHLSYRLTTKWLFQLGKKNRWRDYVKYYDERRAVELKCYHLRARLILENSKKANNDALAKAKKLWLVGNTQPKECIPLFKKLYAGSLITPELLWERIELSMQRGNLKLARHLSNKLNAKDKKSVLLWQRVYKNPTKNIKLKQLRRNTLINRKIIYHAINRIARKDAIKAKQLWKKFTKSHGYRPEQNAEMRRHIALNSASQFSPDALAMLNDIDSDWVDARVRIWKIKIALKQQNWRSLITEINTLNEKEQTLLKWRYWLARAQEKTGNNVSARENYEAIANKTNYYSFLAADRIGKPYTFVSNPIKRDITKLRALETLPQIRRAKELYYLDRVTDARREWNSVIRNLDEAGITQAAVIAHNWQWHDNAILTIAKTRHREDLDLRFPTPYRDEILSNAESMSLDPSWIFGVTRRESAFKKTARSSKGAIGLMQILLSTAQYQSKILGVRKPSTRDLYLTEKNIYFGSSYLNSMLTKFAGNQVLATAAYNAGPNRVRAWLSKMNNMPADIWVDMIPYKETRQYVRAVMAYSTIFDWKLNSKPPTRLKLRMKPVTESYAFARK